MVTSQKDQIQSLIADIERALGKERPKTPWVKTSETEPQREALARAQAYLMSLQQSFDAPGGWGPVDPSTGQLAAESLAPPASMGVSGPTSDASAENVLQALLTEMKFLKSSALEPLRLEMDSLRQERDLLNEEVKSLAERRNQAQLESQQAELALAQQGSASAVNPQAIDEDQLNQFLQVLMARIQENLSVQVTETLGQLESEHSSAMARLTAATELEILELKPTGQIEEMRQLQSRSDQLLANIDSTLQRMFETLQTNIDSYQLSLNEGIENMHSLGRQGEVIVRSLVDHLTQQLGQTAPPEPAFYPSRNALVDATARSPEPTADTVSSLNDILPAAVSPSTPEVEPAETRSVVEDATAPTETSVEPEAASFSEAPIDNVEQLAAALIAENAADSAVDDSLDGSADSSTENFIREDGTIDLDLLKLDIDRSEDDPSLSRDDLMIDSAIADAQVAATEADNSEIEAKVTPTPEAAFLADLTFDDLVVDSEAPPQDTAQDTEPEDTLSLDSGVASTRGMDTPPEPTPEPELAAVLPDLSFRDAEAGADVSVSDGESSAQSADSDDAAPTDSLDANEKSSDEKSSDEESSDEKSDEVEGKLESAWLPDAPDADSEVLPTVNEEIDASAGESALAQDVLTDPNIDAVLPDDLLAVIESDNADAERIATETGDSDLDELASDLEEAVVFDADLPPLSVLEETTSPPESASIPDQPDAASAVDSGSELSSENLSEASDPLEASLTDLDDSAAVEAVEEGSFYESTFEELEDLVNDEPEATPPPVETADGTSQSSGGQFGTEPAVAKPPVDFDDDLDFFPSEPSSSDPSVAAPASELTPTSDTPSSDASGAGVAMAVGLAGAVGVAAVAGESVAAPAVDSAAASVPESAVTDAGGQGPADDEGDDDPTGGEPADWFLGIDFGATGLSAVLINQRGEQVYPLCWNIAGDGEANRFRLPTVAQVNAQPPNGHQLGQVGPTALQQPGPLLRNLKLMVKAGIPEDTASVPWMQWADHVALPLVSLQSAIVDLLKTLNVDHMSCRAVGITNAALRRILADLKGVVVGYPTNWPDTYSFNLREAVLSAGLVSSPDQVFFVEEAIASLLSALPAPKVAADIPENQQPGLYNCNWSGGTVVISAGAILTETAVANLPSELDQLSYQDFAMRGYTYAGDGIDQDIICQLLHLPLKAQEGDLQDEDGQLIEDANSRNWATLGLDEIPLPQPGEADRVVRHRLRQRLNNSPLGHEAVLAARELKIALQEEEEVEVELGDRTWIVTRKDLETKVFLPYIQRINRQVNALLSKKNLAAQNVKQVVCTGGSASLGAIARWLRQKFPNATIIQDTYSGEYSNSCSRVAYGLANLCQYPKVLDSNRHQYNDYFLLLELLRILPEQPLPAGGILHLLEQRGINTQACQAHILALIEGHLPPGLVPTSGDRPLISAQSSDIKTYKALSELPLFRKQGGQIYIADPQQGDRLRSHLEKLLSTKAQSLGEPMTTEALTSSSVVA